MSERASDSIITFFLFKNKLQSPKPSISKASGTILSVWFDFHQFHATEKALLLSVATVPQLDMISKGVYVCIPVETETEIERERMERIERVRSHKESAPYSLCGKGLVTMTPEAHQQHLHKIYSQFQFWFVIFFSLNNLLLLFHSPNQNSGGILIVFGKEFAFFDRSTNITIAAIRIDAGIKAIIYRAII